MNRRRILILSGIDGAGKTTQSKLLEISLENILKVHVKVMHFEAPIWLAAFQSFFVKCTKNLIRNNIHRKKCNRYFKEDENFVRSVFYSLFYLLIGLLFYVKLLFLLMSPNKKTIIICDRYPLIDGLTYISFNNKNVPFSLKLTSIWRVFELILRKISTIRCFLLFIDPELALKRRPEHNLKRQKIHQLLITYFCQMYFKSNEKIDVSDKTITDLHREIVMRFCDRYK